MTAEVITSLVSSLLVSGGVVYLVVEKLFSRKQDQAEAKHREVESVRDTVEYGIPMISIYNEIDKIVEGKTRPIQDKLDMALKKIDVLEENACFKRDCPTRISKKKHLERLENEAEKFNCKN